LTDEIAASKIAVETAKITPLGDAIRYAAFQVVSLITTTGFCTADFDMWPNTVKMILILVMVFGGCAGSTSGGMKIVRIMVILKASLREIMSMIQPRQIIAVRIADKTIDEKQVRSILGFFATFMISTLFLILIMSFIIPDFTTAITAVIASICNCGPGLGGVGPMETYAWIPAPGKWVLSICMLLGRLELYTVIIAFAPATWRK
jgi:trk system potassium uptake protein